MVENPERDMRAKEVALLVGIRLRNRNNRFLQLIVPLGILRGAVSRERRSFEENPQKFQRIGEKRNLGSLQRSREPPDRD